MFTVKTLNKISNVGLSKFDEAKYTIDDSAQSPDAIMVRSAAMHDMEMPSSLLAIARAGAGVNNIPIQNAQTSALQYLTLRVLMQTPLRSL